MKPVHPCQNEELALYEGMKQCSFDKMSMWQQVKRDLKAGYEVPGASH
jgi:hypothetical protein